MSHVVEPAASGRSKCRGCGKPIAKGEYRFGEVLENPFADGDMTVWLHLDCALLRRPESFAEVSLPPEATDQMRYAEQATALLDLGQKHRRLQRACGVERAPSGRAKCRHCQEMIEKESLRIQISFFEEGTFNGGGNIHLSCAEGYFETSEFGIFVRHFASELTEADQAILARL